MRRRTRAGSTGWIVYTSRSAYTAEIAEIIWRLGSRISVLVDNMPDGPEQSDLGKVIAPSDVDGNVTVSPTVLALLTPGDRYSIHEEAVGLGFANFPSLVDPTSVVGRTSTLGTGTAINAMSMVGSRCHLGRFVHVNRSASVGHDAKIDDFVTLGPACVLAGYVTIGRGAFIGAGSVVAPRVTIGANATVGAGALVVKDVEPHTVVVGNPARVLRSDDPGYQGVGVPVD